MLLLALITSAVALESKIEIAPGVFMTRLNAGHPDDGKRNETASALAWLAAGGRGIDTALSYHNQRDVGAAVRASGVPRSEIFVTTKVPCRSAEKSIDEDLSQLQMTSVDLLLIHFPCESTEGTKTAWKALQAAHAAGKARAIGISNFAKKDIDAVLSLGGVGPAVNQCQMSVGSHDDETIAYGKAHNITYEAYSPLRRVDLGDKRIKAIATAHGVSTAQVALKWIDQQDILIATSPGTDAEYIKEDLALGSFTLADDEMDKLRKI